MGKFNYESSYKASINCTWTYCADGTHFPTENGKYLVCDSDGDYEVVDFFKKGSVVRTHNNGGLRVDVITNNDAFICSDVDGSYPIECKDVVGYVKISDINVYKVGEKHD